MDDRDSIWTWVIPVLAGSIAGALIALVFAPQSGAKTRTQIQEKGIELKDKATEAYARAQVQAEEALGDLRVTIDQLATRVDEMIAEGKAWLGDEHERVPEEQSTLRVSI
jgi:gas vesicle protein